MPWKEHVWYTLKFRAAVEDGKAVLRGKVWQRGEPEPAEWTIDGDRRGAQRRRQPRPVRQRQRRRDLLRQHHGHAEQRRRRRANR